MSGLIPEDVINRVREAFDVVEFVSRYLPLKKAGASYKALCPFHKEKTPSFIVSPSRQSFHCFGCGKGGNVVHFLMAMERLSFPEAIRRLAKDAAIDIPDTRGPAPDRTGEQEREQLYEANRRAADFFARTLASTAGRTAREYVRSRGISDEMVERCRLGYSPDSWDALLNAASAAGIIPPVLARAGLAVQRTDGDGYYDRFRNRLIFPIFDTQDRVIGFGARTMADNDPKYLNTPETPLFSKGRNLYGLNWARRAIADLKRVAVVEGYTDVIMAHQHGYLPVVATLGTALTRDHIHSLRRFAERVDVVFDSDPAGLQAAERSMELFLTEGAGELVAAGFDVRIATVPTGKDPCDLILAQGIAAFTTALDDAVDVFTRKIQIAAQRHDTTTVEGKTRAIDEVLALVAAVPNAVGRELRVDSVVRTLSDLFDINEAALRARIDQLQRRRRTGLDLAEPAVAPAKASDPAELGLIEALLTAPEAIPDVFDRIQPDDFSSDLLGDLFLRMKQFYDDHGALNPDHVLGQVEDPQAASVVSAILNGPRRPGIESTALDCIRTLLKRRVQRSIRQLKKQLDEARADGDLKRADDLSSRFLKLQREVHAI